MNSGLSPQGKDWASAVLASSRDHAVVFIDVRARIVGWQGAAEMLFGYASEEIVGQDQEILFVPEDRALGMPAQELEGARVSGRSEDDRWHQRKDGSRFWGNGVMERVPGPDGRPAGYCKILRDRTDVRTRMELLRNTLHARMAEHDSAVNFLMTLGHELRNAVAPVLYAASMLEHANDPAARADATDIIKRQATTMKRLLDDWLADVRTGTQRLRIEIEEVELGRAVSAAVEGIRPRADEHRLHLRLVLPPVPITFEADPSRLQQMLSNLLSNAVKYTPSGGHVDVNVSVEGEMAVIRVLDDGSGISSEVLPRVFELFTREVSTPTGPEGLGIGLAAVKQLAELHGGTIDVRSPGRGLGSVFTLRLPLRQSERET